MSKNKITFSTNINNRKVKNGFRATSIIYDKKYNIDSKKLISLLHKKKIPVRHFFLPLSEQNGYKKIRKKINNCKIGNELYKRGITLPSHYKLNKKRIHFICENITKILKHYEK